MIFWYLPVQNTELLHLQEMVVDSNVMVAATKAIKKTDGIGIPTVKPWNLDVDCREDGDGT